MTEKQIQAAILNHFGSMPALRLWRQNTGLAVPLWALPPTVDASTLPRISFGIQGAGDLSGIASNGRRLEIEVKTATGRQSKQQKRYQTMIERFGGIYILARSIDDVSEGLSKSGIII